MPEFLVILAGIFGVIGTVTSIAVGYGTIQQRKKEPNEKRWDELRKWRLSIDEHLLAVDSKLDSDNRRIKHSEEEAEENQKFQRIMLKSMRSILNASPSSDEFKTISAEIDDFLIKR